MVQRSPLCHVRVLKQMTEWLPGNYEITLRKKKEASKGSYAICCLHKQVIKKIPRGDRNPQNFLNVKNMFGQADCDCELLKCVSLRARILNT